MARLVALEWDADEARVLVANSRGTQLTLEKAFTVALPARDGKSDADHAAAGEAVQSALAKQGIGKSDCVVAVGRASIEMKYLSLPPAPDDELPELVRFQAMREFNQLGEEWPLDFLPLDKDAEQPRNVLAAAISPQLVEQIRTTCQSAGIEPKRLILRPCAVASLFRRHRPAEGEQLRLLVDLLANEVDLTAMRGDMAVFLRTARITTDSHSAESLRPLLLEIRRTMAALSQRLGGQRVDAIYLCGDGVSQRAIVKQIETELGLPTHVFDPFETVQQSNAFRASPPEHMGRFAPLVGMLTDESENAAHEIDFLHPRQKPAPPRRGNKYALAGITAAAVAALVIFGVWLRVNALDEEIEQLAATSSNLNGLLKRSAELEKKVGEIDKWAASDIVWLDELHELAKEMPSSEDVKLTDLRVLAHADGGTIDLQGVARTNETIESLERRVLDARHRVVGKVGQDNKHDRYRWSFKSSVLIDPTVARVETKAEPAKAPETPAPDAAARAAKGS